MRAEMMKRLLFLYIALSCAVLGSARTAADSVKVRLETSAGAEIGMDGDISSTNILSVKTSLGKHIVKVTYGADFVREYEIDVTKEETFTFSIDGKLSVTSVPAGRSVSVDGIERGQTPLELNIIGDHNVVVAGDDQTYFDATDRVSVKPFEEVARDYTLGKRPPRTYGMFMLNYSGGGPGVFLGMCKRLGAYLRFNMSFNQNDVPSTWDNSGNFPSGIHEDSDTKYKLIAGGLTARLHKNIYAYVGGGYGQYLKCYNKNGSDCFAPYGAEGALVDIGVILKWKAILISGGYTRFLGSCNPDQYQELNVGIGFTIHKNKKR